MALTAGHYNVVLKGKWDGGQDIVNSFFFTLDMDGGTLVGDDAEYFSLGQKFWEAIEDDLLECTNQIVEYTQVDVFKADGVDVGNSGFYSIPTGDGVGHLSGDALPPFVCWTFQYTRPSALFRHGYKRFAGVGEALQVKGVVQGGAAAALATLAATLRADIGLNDALVNRPFIQPALVQRIYNGVPVDPDVWYAPSTIQFKKIGSQNTRKYGVGS